MSRLVPVTIGLPVDDLFQLREDADELPRSAATDYRQPTYAHVIRGLVREHCKKKLAAADRAAKKATPVKRARKAAKR